MNVLFLSKIFMLMEFSSLTLLSAKNRMSKRSWLGVRVGMISKTWRGLLWGRGKRGLGLGLPDPSVALPCLVDPGAGHRYIDTWVDDGACLPTSSPRDQFFCFNSEIGM